MNAALQFFARICVLLFLIGVAGSLVVVVVSFVQDLELLVADDDEADVDAAKSQA